jgi:hypothetical protein
VGHATVESGWIVCRRSASTVAPVRTERVAETTHEIAAGAHCGAIPGPIGANFIGRGRPFGTIFRRRSNDIVIRCHRARARDECGCGTAAAAAASATTTSLLLRVTMSIMAATTEDTMTKTTKNNYVSSSDDHDNDPTQRPQSLIQLESAVVVVPSATEYCDHGAR